MKVLSIVGVSLFATSFHAAAFVPASTESVEQKTITANNPYAKHAVSAKALTQDISQIIPVAGCQCALCTALRSVAL